jgi:hypothetical protein
MTSIMAAAVFLSPAVVSAQAGDAAYCKALSDMEQCKAGDSVSAIPVLEQRLRNAKIALPPRG